MVCACVCEGTARVRWPLCVTMLHVLLGMLSQGPWDRSSWAPPTLAGAVCVSVGVCASRETQRVQARTRRGEHVCKGVLRTKTMLKAALALCL